MASEPFLPVHSPEIGHHAAAEIQRTPIGRQHHLGGIGVLQHLHTVIGLERLHQRGDVGGRVGKARLQGLDLSGMDKGLVALDIDNHISRAAYVEIGLPATVRAAAMAACREYGLSAKLPYRLQNALVIGAHIHLLQHTAGLFVHMLDDRFSAQQGQRLAWEPCAGIPGRYQSYIFQWFHISAIFFMLLCWLL